MYFNGGTLQILLGALGNSNGGGPGPSTKNVYREPWQMKANPLSVMEAGQTSLVVDKTGIWHVSFPQ